MYHVDSPIYYTYKFRVVLKIFPGLDLQWISLSFPFSRYPWSCGCISFWFLFGSHLPLVVGWVTSSWKPWLDKCSRSPITTWVELLVLEALVGKMLWKPLVGRVNSSRRYGWTNALEFKQELCVDMLVLEALVGTNTLEPCTTWVETNLVMISDVRLWGGITSWGLRWSGL